MNRWDRLLESYLEEYGARGLAQERVDQVWRELSQWGNWLKRRRPRPKLEEVDADLIIGYVRGRTAFRAKATLSGVMSTLRGMGDFLVRQQIWTANPMRWLKGPKLNGQIHLPCRIGSAEMQRLWEGAATSRQGYHQHLWLTVLAVLYGTGIRRGELERLDVSDWDLQEGILKVDGRKTGWERCVPMPALACRCLEAYLPHRQNHLDALGRHQQPALFVNQDGERLRGLTVSRGIQRLARRCGLERITLHRFRHTCASDLLAGGVRLPEVQRLLGHQTIGTTVRYLHIADPQRHEAVTLHPINQMLSAAGTGGRS